ncbi:hypothetical protein [Pseudomonas aeruginosa]|uniref:hypothetical protein n=1 Tax=Pseudomonas aeruginosa TaxID=287 RepID=UPI0022377BF8|nr:hypothetical protein [Pseudomonas aeruginosa]MCW4649227.1 hypothetical protein [Pseudomonas aeruginosa]
MKRNVVTQNTNTSPTSFATAARGRSYIYRLDCGHTLTGDYRRLRKGLKVHPKTLDCDQCDQCDQSGRFIASDFTDLRMP